MFKLTEKNGACFFQSTLLRSTHGFSTRIGGFSVLEHTRGLNIAYGHGDGEETVKKNVCALADAVGVEARAIISVPQVHSATVRLVDADDAGMGVFKKAEFECDGYVSTLCGLPIGVKTADCVPILLEARSDEGEVLAVSAVHAGWRGTASGIVQNAVEMLCSLGAKRQNIYVAIGACIDECCYEVGEDFTCQIREKLGQSYENRFIKKRETGSIYADLKGMNLAILSECGIPRENIDVSEGCTCCQPDLYYSHRRQRGVRGAMMSLICK